MKYIFTDRIVSAESEYVLGLAYEYLFWDLFSPNRQMVISGFLNSTICFDSMLQNGYIIKLYVFRHILLRWIQKWKPLKKIMLLSKN